LLFGLKPHGREVQLPIAGLFSGAFSIPDYMREWFVNNKWEKIWKKVVVA
jgi:hypothetical protein